MGTYLQRLFIFLLPVILLLGLLEALLRLIPNDYAFKHERLTQDGGTFVFLILGSSHAYKGVDPDLMASNGFNLANISQDLAHDRALLEHHIDGLTALHDVFLSISYGSLVGCLEDSPESWRVKNYTIYMNITSDRLNVSDHLELLGRPMAQQVKMLRDHLLYGKDNIRCSPNGANITAPKRSVNLAADGQEAAKRHTRPPGTSTAKNRAELDRIIALAATRGIRVHLFLPPAHASYRAALSHSQLEDVRLTCRALAARHPNVTFDDLLADPRFLQEDFGDADHLSPSGAAKLSRILAAYLSIP